MRKAVGFLVLLLLFAMMANDVWLLLSPHEGTTTYHFRTMTRVLELGSLVIVAIITFAAYALFQRNDRLKRDLEAAVKAREAFIGMVSHELTSPLAALRLGLGILERKLAEAGFDCSLLQRVKAAALNLTELTKSLTDVARMQSRRFLFEPSKVNLWESVVSTVEGFKDIAAERGSTITVKGGGKDIIGQWDRVRIQQVISNILSNAVKYGEGRPIEVEVHGDAKVAVFTVTDHGVGISPDKRDAVFLRFYREQENSRAPGLGIGLWVVKQIVNAHGGHVEVESREGEGSVFRVTLPRETVPTPVENIELVLGRPWSRQREQQQQ